MLAEQDLDRRIQTRSKTFSQQSNAADQMRHTPPGSQHFLNQNGTITPARTAWVPIERLVIEAGLGELVQPAEEKAVAVFKPLAGTVKAVAGVERTETIIALSSSKETWSLDVSG